MTERSQMQQPGLYQDSGAGPPTHYSETHQPTDSRTSLEDYNRNMLHYTQRRCRLLLISTALATPVETGRAAVVVKAPATAVIAKIHPTVYWPVRPTAPRQLLLTLPPIRE